VSYLGDQLDPTNDPSGFVGKASNPFPVGPDPFTQPTKAKQKKATKTAVKSADPYDSFKHDNTDPAPEDQGQVGQGDYKFTAVTNPEGSIEDYTETPPTNTGYTEGGILRGDVAQQSTDPKQLSASQYDALTKEASKGNKLAQQILVSGHYKAHAYPSLAQDLTKLEDPFVQALSGLPALAQSEQAAANKVTQPYDFTNAEAQVNNLLGQMGSSQRMTTSPETNAYIAGLQGIVSQGANNLTSGALGGAVPSIMSALEGLGPAAKESEKATPYAALLSALLSHQQYETVYGGQSPSSSGDPAWLQNLIASVTGTGIGGGLVSPAIAAGAVGTTPSATPSPTGSNG
jgi:hypothetical protein